MEKNLDEVKKEEVWSVITADTVISGDVNTASALKVFGEVKGNVVSSKAVEIHGRVNGNITGEKVSLIKGKVEGNIDSKTKVEVNKNVSLVGNITANDLQASGSIKGDIDVRNLITLESDASCEGSITASLINIKTGAKMNGPLTVFDREKPKNNTEIKVGNSPKTED